MGKSQRKPITSRGLKRSEAKRDPYAKVLIVCEDSKSAPIYFESLRVYYRLSSTNVKITGESDSSPDKVWQFARELYRLEKKRGDAFDKVYCVFDRDTHTTFEKTCQSIKDLQPHDTFFAITSEPCFEYWLLLHFIYTTQPFYPSQQLTAAKKVQATLDKYLPDYTKGQGVTFDFLIGQLEIAKSNATRALKEAEANQNYNPSTYIHKLVSFLEALKKP